MEIVAGKFMYKEELRSAAGARLKERAVEDLAGISNGQHLTCNINTIKIRCMWMKDTSPKRERER